MNLSLRHLIEHRCPLPAWARRAGAAGFLFFLIKGLLWLALPGILLTLGH